MSDRRTTRAGASAAGTPPGFEEHTGTALCTDSDDERLPADQVMDWAREVSQDAAAEELSRIIAQADERARWRAPKREAAGWQFAAATERLSFLDEAARREAAATDAIRKQLAKSERAAMREELKQRAAQLTKEADAMAKRIEELSRQQESGEVEDLHASFTPAMAMDRVQQQPLVAGVQAVHERVVLDSQAALTSPAKAAPPPPPPAKASTPPPPPAKAAPRPPPERAAASRPHRETAGRFVSEVYDDAKYRKPKRPTGPDEWEDECHRCGQAGLLVCCSSCRRAAHPRCYGFSKPPDDDWRCSYCSDSV